MLNKLLQNTSKFHSPKTSSMRWCRWCSISAQAREALLQAGLLADVNSAVSQLSEKAQIQWEYRATVKRDNEFVQELITNGLLTNTQLDALFTLAATL